MPRTAFAATDFERYLSSAVSLYEDLEYERALSQLERARKAAVGVEQDTLLSMYEGTILADMGRWAEARAAFRTALSMDPEAKLPLKVAPKVAREFEEVRGRVRKELASRPRPATPRSEPARPAPTEPPAVASRTDRPEQVPAPRLTPSEPSPVLTPTVEEKRGRPVTVPLVLLGAGVAAAGVGTYFGLDSRSQESAARDARFQGQAAARLDDARGSARWANILFGTAGLAATGALVTYLLMPGDATPAPEASR
jgi:tetratricopeptide (TPR) repeat protein